MSASNPFAHCRGDPDHVPNLCVTCLFPCSFSAASACGDAENQSSREAASTGGGGQSTATTSVGGSTSAGGSTVIGGSTAIGGSTSTGGVSTATGGTVAFDPNGTGGTMSDDETPVKKHGKLHVTGTHLLDEHDAPIQLKGPSSMWLNWENTGYASNPDGVRHLRNNWNATVIRAAMGVDATGAYLTNPEGMKTKLRAVVDLAIQLGIYVIIDWHDHAAETHQAESIAFFNGNGHRLRCLSERDLRDIQ